MKQIVSIFFLLFTWIVAIGQTPVSGIVTTKKGEPLTGVNVYFQDTYAGTTTGLNGEFELTIDGKEDLVLVARFIGFQSYQQSVKAGENQKLDIILKESTQSLDAVTITAGSFAAGDKKRATVLEPLDIYTTAGALGDMVGALTTLPGTQPAVDDGRLLVRGGDAYETKTIIDGLLAGKPYFSKVPDVPTRGRFTASLFSGTMFNTGGYSAEYGQALSSVLVLNTNDLATENSSSVSLMSVGGGADITQCWENNSISLMGNYTTLKPYYNLVDNQFEWTKPVEVYSGGLIYRHKTKKNGLLKFYLSGDKSDLDFLRETGVDNLVYQTKLNTGNLYTNLVFHQPLGEKSSLKTGALFTHDNQDVIYAGQKVETLEQNVEVRSTMVHDLADGIKLTYGLSDTYSNYRQNYQASPEEERFRLPFTDHILASFAETEIRFSKNFAIRPGLRYEYSTLLKEGNLAPRVALAFNTGKSSQISASYGHFYQNPNVDILKFSSDLSYEKAQHYILGFQFGSVKDKLFRVESYYKKYDKLVTFNKDEVYMPDSYKNNGSGEAKGVDVFWRDKSSIKNLDYWVSYSYIDTERAYREYTKKVQPDFISNHNFSVVAKYYIPSINCQFGATTWWASARNWYEETTNGYITHNADNMSDLSLNVSYLTHIAGQFTVIHFSVSNVLGSDNLYGYSRSPISDSSGDYAYLPLKNDVKQFVFLGLFITLK